MANFTTIRVSLGVCVLLVSLAAIGCGAGVKLVPAEGVVKIDGKPAANIAVQFLPDAVKGSKGPTSFGTTDTEGKFKLKTYDGRDGAVVGPHQVILVDQDEERPPQGRPMTRWPRLDAKYASATTGLTAEVKAGSAITLEATGPR